MNISLPPQPKQGASPTEWEQWYESLWRYVRPKVASSGDANATIASSTTLHSVTALTASRTLTLPATSKLQDGDTVTVMDESGSAGTYPIVIQRAGTDTINGLTSVRIATGYGAKTLTKRGAGLWRVSVDLGMEQSLQSNTEGNWPGGASEYADEASLTLTPGVWDLFGYVAERNDGAVAAGLTRVGIGETSGNNSPNLGLELVQYNIGTSGYRYAHTAPSVRVSPTASTTYYLKVRHDASGTNLKSASNFLARRVGY